MFTNAMVHKLQLVLENNTRGAFERRFEKLEHAFNHSDIQLNALTLNHKYFLDWLTQMFAGIYVCIGGALLIRGHGNCTLGVFLAQLNVIYHIGSAWGHVYRIIREIHNIIPQLVVIIKLMNLPTDFEDVAAIHHYRQEITEWVLCNQPDIDAIPITVRDLGADYTLQTSRIVVSLNLSGQMEIKQGQLLCIVGAHSSGKSTLLKLLAGVPARGVEDANKVYVPAHMRTMYVSQKAIFFNDTLMMNLTLGIDVIGEEGTPERVASICRRLGISERLIQLVESDVVCDWEKVLSIGELKLLSLARAFVSNYEFMAVDSPTSYLNGDAREGSWSF